MRFKIKVNENTKHQEICTSVRWSINNEAYSLSDDNTILKWDPNSLECTKFIDLEGFGTDFDFLPGQRGLNDLIAISYSDGSFQIMQKSGKIEKKVADAHKGAIVQLKWSLDGSLVTCGEDGAIKIWSKQGIIRSNIIQIDKPIYCIVWSPDNDAILYSSDKMIFIKPIQAGQKQIQWKAHDGVVSKVDWNSTNNLILSCGEDCKYKVFDTYGRLLFASAPYDYVITSIAWSPNGDYFAVGAYDMLRLCDRTGWTHSFHKTNQGSLMSIAWTSDGTICAGAAGNGTVVFGHVVERSITYDKWEITLTEDNKIHIIDLIDEMNNEFDFKERVINMSMKYNNLIISTSAHCYIYSFKNWNTPYIFDIRDAVSQISQSSNYFCLVEVTLGLMIYNYEGKLISNPKIQGTKFEHLSHKKLAISNDVLAIVDGGNNKQVKFFEMNSGKPLNFVVEHSLEILEIHLNQTEIVGERKIAFVDQNHDLHITPIYKKDIVKLAAMTDAFLWNEKYDMLVALSDQRFVTWYYPTAVYVDRDLLEQVKVMKESADLTRNSTILSFQDINVQIRRKDGAIVNQSVSPYPALLFEFCEKGKWEKAIKLCRYVKESTLWAALAGLSLQFKELNTAEIALAAIEAADKVIYITKIMQLESEPLKNALLAIFFKKPQEAESIYIQNKFYYRAIKLNIKLYKWERAIELALQYNVHQDTVLYYRQKYLQSAGQEETLRKYQKLAQDIKKVDEQTVKDKIKAEKARYEIKVQ